MNDVANRSDDVPAASDTESEDAPSLSSKSGRPIVFESAVDGWLVVVMAMAPAISFLGGIYAWWIGQADGAAILFACGAAATLVMTVIALPCRYTLLDDSLSIRFGIMVHQIPLSEIVSAHPTTSLRSGPALSLKRIAIQTPTKTFMISPQERDGFLSELQRRSIGRPEA